MRIWKENSRKSAKIRTIWLFQQQQTENRYDEMTKNVSHATHSYAHAKMFLYSEIKWKIIKLVQSIRVYSTCICCHLVDFPIQIKCVALFLLCVLLHLSYASHCQHRLNVHMCGGHFIEYIIVIYVSILRICIYFHFFSYTNTHGVHPPQDNLMRLLLPVFLCTSIIFHNEFYLILFTLWFDLYPSYSIGGTAQIHRTWLIVHSSAQVNLNLTNFVCVFIDCLSLFERLCVCLSQRMRIWWQSSDMNLSTV